MKLREKLEMLTEEIMLKALLKQVEDYGVDVIDDASLIDGDDIEAQFQMKISGSNATVELQRIVYNRKFVPHPYMKMIVIAHELGHAIDFKERFEADTIEWYARVEDIAYCLDLEKVAWVNGIRVLKRLGFKKWKETLAFAETCFQSYLDHYCWLEGADEHTVRSQMEAFKQAMQDALAGRELVVAHE